jgi:hypothetical protein
MPCSRKKSQEGDRTHISIHFNFPLDLSPSLPEEGCYTSALSKNHEFNKEGAKSHHFFQRQTIGSLPELADIHPEKTIIFL